MATLGLGAVSVWLLALGGCSYTISEAQFSIGPLLDNSADTQPEFVSLVIRFQSPDDLGSAVQPRLRAGDAGPTIGALTTTAADSTLQWFEAEFVVWTKEGINKATGEPHLSRSDLTKPNGVRFHLERPMVGLWFLGRRSRTLSIGSDMIDRALRTGQVIRIPD